MGKKIEDMDAQELVEFFKSNGFSQEDQVEMIKAQAWGRTAKDRITESNGAGSRSATHAKTVAQPSAPGENVGIIDDPDEIQRRFRDEYVDSSEYNKGSEVDEQPTKKSPKKKATAKIDSDDDGDDDDVQHGDMGDDGEFEPDGDEPGGEGEDDEDEDDDDQQQQKPPMRQSSKKSTTTKKSHAAIVDDYEDAYYTNFLKGSQGKEIAEIFDGLPIVEKMTDLHAHGFATLEAKLDRAVSAVEKSNARAARAEALLKSQGVEIQNLKKRIAVNHNNVLEYTKEVIEKSFGAGTLVKAQGSTPVSQSVTPNIVPLVTRPTLNGATAIITPGGQQEIRKSNRLTGNFKSDKKLLTKSLESAAENGEDGATDILAQIDMAKGGEDLEYIAGMMPENWFRS